MISPLPGLTETKPGSATFPLPGVVADVVDETTGESVEQGQGLLVLKRPWPAMLRTLYGDDERYVETYFSRFGNDTYLVGDAAIRDKDGYLWIVGRIDDVINVSGHRLSTAEVESAIVAHDKVAEAAVVAQSDELTGQAIVAFVTLQGDLEGTPEIEAQIREHVAEPDRQARATEAHPVERGPAQDAFGEDHAPASARHRRGPDARRRHDASRPDGDGRARTEGRGRPGQGGIGAMADASTPDPRAGPGAVRAGGVATPRRHSRSWSSKPSFGVLLGPQRRERRSAHEDLLGFRATSCCATCASPGERDVTRLARQLARTEDKLERVLQEVEELRDELARAAIRERVVPVAGSRQPAEADAESRRERHRDAGPGAARHIRVRERDPDDPRRADRSDPSRSRLDASRDDAVPLPIERAASTRSRSCSCSR